MAWLLLQFTGLCALPHDHRPRRFGKSMALKMMAAYYGRGCDSKDLFAGLKIERAPSFEEHLNQYDVIYLNMQQFLIGAKGREITEYLEQEVLEELLEEYGHLLKRHDMAHMEVASILTYNDENSLSRAIGLAYYSAWKDYKMIREFPTGRGFADVVFLPLPFSDKPAIVVELKYDKSAHAAIEQIKE